jgi:hypothetical protein
LINNRRVFPAKRYLSIADAPADDPVQQVIAHVQVQVTRLN